MFGTTLPYTEIEIKSIVDSLFEFEKRNVILFRFNSGSRRNLIINVECNLTISTVFSDGFIDSNHICVKFVTHRKLFA